MELNIDALAEEGWKARRRIIAGHEYISIRKNGKDRGLGPFKQELWDKLIEHGMVTTKVKVGELTYMRNSIEKNNSEIARLRKELKEVKARPKATDTDRLLKWNASKCPHAKAYYSNRFCSRYFSQKKPSDIIRLLPNVTFKRSTMGFDGYNKKWRFTPHPDICGLCNPVDNLFSRFNENAHEDLTRLEDRINKIQSFINYLNTTAKQRVRTDKMKFLNCKHLGEDGYCTYWHYEYREEGRDQKRREDGKWCDNVRVNPIICVACPSYEVKSASQNIISNAN